MPALAHAQRPVAPTKGKHIGPAVTTGSKPKKDAYPSFLCHRQPGADW